MSSFRQLMMRNKGGGGTLNATVVGNPTISNDFILSNCGYDDYLSIILGNIIPENCMNWKICFKIKFISQKLVLVFDGLNNFYNTRIQFFHPDLPNNCGWLLGGGYVSPWEQWLNTRYSLATSINIPNLNIDTWYYLIFGFDGTKYYIDYGTDGTNFTTLTYASLSVPTVFNTNITKIFIPNRSSTTEKVEAELDLKETNIYVNGNKAWEAVSF